MSDLAKFIDMLDRANIPYRTDWTMEVSFERDRVVNWVTIFDPSGSIVDCKFSDDGELESIATENTP